MKKTTKRVLIGFVFCAIVGAALSPNENTEETTSNTRITAEAPELTEEPITVEVPESTEEPITTEVPESTEEPITTEIPESTEESTTTEALTDVEETKVAGKQIDQEGQAASEKQAVEESQATSEAQTINDNKFNTYNNESQQKTEDTYVLNTSKMKIHRPSCSSVKKIAPENYATSSSSIDDLITQGYSTCGNCFK